MPLGSQSGTVDVSKKSILIAKVAVKNDHKPSQQPDLCCIFLNKDGSDLSFTKPDLVKTTPSGEKEYLVSIDIAPGTAKILSFRFTREIPLVMRATADLIVDKSVEIPGNSIVYLGNISVAIKPKSREDQPSAGLPFPLVDQAVAGFSTGTFEIKIEDRYESDVREFRARYPNMSTMDIAKNILPSSTDSKAGQ